MKITEQYLRSIIKEAIEEVKDELEEAKESDGDSSKPSSYDASIQKGYTLHVYQSGKEVVEGPDGKLVSGEELQKLKNTRKGFRAALESAKARAKKAGYGK